jgi:hypothetical protein
LIKRKDLNGAKNYPLMIEGAGGVDFDISQIFLFNRKVLTIKK